MKELTDQQRMDWLEEHIDSLEYGRDLSKGGSVTIEYCSEFSGCPCEESAKTLREAIDSAVRADKEAARGELRSEEVIRNQRNANW